MNITTEDILKELRAGADLDSIGRDFADMLNEAKERYEKEELERVQKKKEEAKFKSIGDVIESIVCCLDLYYPTMCSELFPGDKIDIDALAQDVMSMLDLGEELYSNPELRNAILALGADNPWAGFVQKAEKKGPNCPSTSTKNNFKDILTSFLDD